MDKNQKTLRTHANAMADSSCEVHAALKATAHDPVNIPESVKYFSFDDDNGFQLFDTENDAREYVQGYIAECRKEAALNGEWPGEVESACFGIVLGKSKPIPVGENDDGEQGFDFVISTEPEQ